MSRTKGGDIVGTDLDSLTVITTLPAVWWPGAGSNRRPYRFSRLGMRVRQALRASVTCIDALIRRPRNADERMRTRPKMSLRSCPRLGRSGASGRIGTGRKGLLIHSHKQHPATTCDVDQWAPWSRRLMTGPAPSGMTGRIAARQTSDSWSGVSRPLSGACYFPASDSPEVNLVVAPIMFEGDLLAARVLRAA